MTELALQTSILVTPGFLIVDVANTPANDTVSFRLNADAPANEIDFAVTDDDGSLVGHMVLIDHRLPEGHHTLYANGSMGTASAAFVVDNDDLITEDDVPAPVPPTLITRVGIQRWYFQDPTGQTPTHTFFPRNPEKYTTPYQDKVMSYDFSASVVNGHPISMEGAPRVVEWEFTGKLLSVAEESSFYYWFTRSYRIYVITHENRAHLVYLKGFDCGQDRSNQGLETMAKREYTMHASLYGPPIQL